VPSIVLHSISHFALSGVAVAIGVLVGCACVGAAVLVGAPSVGAGVADGSAWTSGATICMAAVVGIPPTGSFNPRPIQPRETPPAKARATITTMNTFRQNFNSIIFFLFLNLLPHPGNKQQTTFDLLFASG
jgi:hypothetical protein